MVKPLNKSKDNIVFFSPVRYLNYILPRTKLNKWHLNNNRFKRNIIFHIHLHPLDIYDIYIKFLEGEKQNIPMEPQKTNYFPLNRLFNRDPGILVVVHYI